MALSKSKAAFWKFIASIFMFLGFGVIFTLLSLNQKKVYAKLVLPLFTPGFILYHIVWLSLFLTLGISFFFIWNSLSDDKKYPVALFFANSSFCLLWAFSFFRVEEISLSLVLIFIIIFLTLVNSLQFFLINKTAAILLIPYFLWLVFSAYLNTSFYMLNL